MSNEDSDLMVLSGDFSCNEAWRHTRKRRSSIDDGRLQEYRTTPQQTAALTEMFKHNPNPNRRETWYRNRRSKEQRIGREEELLLMKRNMEGHDLRQKREIPRDPRMSINSIVNR
ncbi:hypothetical protein PROFUN_08045 [Planoprotostelium fungivorum]|uniref:Homeobox domain-containing protein n=1 Tax=Planoprotostelium fungivorum TaxID=1890364 RepID=A0A2P6NKF9_9EUKA|nr:hypothetical protein PROFUN_08045 [Planoprotostelium fungivorum]